MTVLDWTIVLGVGLIVVGFGAVRSRSTKNTSDWLLGGRSLPFWLAGVSMFATSVDGGEYVSINGATYQAGLSTVVSMTFGVVVGGIIAAFVVVPTMYAAGVVTNAEYLETRFTPATRVISVVVQIQYRTSALATILVALHLMLVEVARLNDYSAWWLVVGLTAATTIYAAWGGLKTVAATDALLGCVMIVATVVLWVCLWQQAGGWSGATTAIADRSGPDVARQLGHIGTPLPEQPAPFVMLGGWILIVTGYFVVNHTQTMKMLGVRSMWDLKMSVLVGAALIMISGLLSGTIGYFGRALLPGLDHPDLIYPRIVDAYLGPGLKGVVVAGVVASAVSTIEGIGAALSALFTRDIYARLLVRSASDSHYLRVSRLSTVVVVAGSFLYVPLILRADGIVSFFVGITSVLVTPLLTIYLVGVLTRAHRRSAIVGLTAGFVYGLAAFFAREGYIALPDWLTEKFVAFLWSAVITATAMLAASCVLGSEPSEVESREELLAAREDENPSGKFWRDPRVWAAVLLVSASVLVFGVFW